MSGLDAERLDIVDGYELGALMLREGKIAGPVELFGLAERDETRPRERPRGKFKMQEISGGGRKRYVGGEVSPKRVGMLVDSWARMGLVNDQRAT